MANVFRMTAVLAALVVAVLLPECSGVAVTAIDCSSGDSDCSGITDAVCDNAGTPKCKCKTDYRVNPTDDTACVAAIGSACTSDTDCTDAAANSMCDTMCKCNTGYKVDATTHACNAVLDEACTTDDECTTTVTNSACTGTDGSKTCTCDAGYKQVAQMCSKVIGLTCANNVDCTSYLMGTECDSSKCQCVTPMYKESDHICKTALGQDCAANTPVCVDNAGCVDAKCTCNADFMEKEGVCDSAQSVGISTAVLAVSLLVMMIQKLC